MGEINPDYHRALEMMEMANRAMEYLKNTDRKVQAEEDFRQTLEKLWLSKSNEKQN
jgi:hypothetical protein